jgi:hypothetical protein
MFRVTVIVKPQSAARDAPKSPARRLVEPTVLLRLVRSKITQSFFSIAQTLPARVPVKKNATKRPA